VPIGPGSIVGGIQQIVPHPIQMAARDIPRRRRLTYDRILAAEASPGAAGLFAAGGFTCSVL
jgi:hypothetical protein